MTVSIDRATCTGCGSCAADCIRGALTLRGGKAEYAGDCLECGHCVAICPVRAVSMPSYDMADVEEWEPGRFELEIGPLLRTIKFRRSVRRFEARPVPRAQLELLVQAGRYTATASNRQDCRFLFVQEGLEALKELVWDEAERLVQAAARPDAADANRQLAEPLGRFLALRAGQGVDYLFRDAPAALYIAADNPVDAALAAQNMELAAVAQGLGALYNGYLVHVTGRSRAALDWLGAGEKPLRVCMLLGHPAVRYRRTAPRKPADVRWL